MRPFVPVTLHHPFLQMSVSSVMHGNKFYTLQPNLHEQLTELQVIELTLPEDINRLKTANRRDQEQVNAHLVDMLHKAHNWWLNE